MLDGSIMRLWDTTASPEKLSPREVDSVVRCLLSSSPVLGKGLIGGQEAKEGFLRMVVETSTVLNLRQAKAGDQPQHLYSEGMPTNLCTVVLAGGFQGQDGEEKGPWSVLFSSALLASNDAPYLADQSITLTSETAKCIQISWSTFQSILKVYDFSNLEGTRARVQSILYQPVSMRRRRSLSISESLTASDSPYKRSHSRVVQMSLKRVPSMARPKDPTKLVSIVSEGVSTSPPSPQD